MMFGPVTVAEPYISIFLADKSLSCVPLMQILCIAYISYSLHSANDSTIKSLGESNLTLRIETIKTIIRVTLLLITIPVGLKVTAASYVFCSFITVYIEARSSGELLDYSYKEQLIDFANLS